MKNRQLYRLAACLIGAASLLLQSCSESRFKDCDRLCGTWGSVEGKPDVLIYKEGDAYKVTVFARSGKTRKLKPETYLLVEEICKEGGTSMRKRLLLLCAGTFFLAGQIRAQWVVTDPGNLAQSIINMSDNIVHTSSTATSTAQNFAETVKIYQQYKKYYDALKSVNNLVKDARKVSEIILMVGDVSEIYVTNFQKMLGDENFSPEELDAIAFGYTKLLEESNGVLQDLRQVINVSTLSMTDKDRMDVVDDCYASMRRYRNLVNYYTNRNIAVSFLRARKKNDLDRVLKLYGNDTSKYW